MAHKGLASTGDKITAAIEAIYAAGLDRARWPTALTAVANAMKGHAATFETFDRHAGAHRAFESINIPTAAEMAYLAHHIAGNPRWLFLLRQQTGHIAWDYQFIDEHGMDHAPFYAELLGSHGLRYFLMGMAHVTPDDIALYSVQFPRRHGHPEKPEIEVMKILLPHFQRAHDVAERLASMRGQVTSFVRAFDWVDDGVAIIDGKGLVIYANPSLHDLVRRADVVRLRKGELEFLTVDARGKFAAALGAVRRLKDGGLVYEKPTDFTVARAPDQPRCLVSVRPLSKHEQIESGVGDVLVLIRDPTARSRTPGAILRDTFGLTVAECDLALAVQARQTLNDYARTRGVTMNTVYTQLRRIREKTGSHSIADLIETLEALRPPLRLDG